jgi:TatD DNase family protein
MIDSHAHLHYEPLASNIESVVNSFTAEEGKYILSCATNFETATQELGFSMEYETVLTAIGIDPEVCIPGSDIYFSGISHDWIDKNVSKVEDLLKKHKDVVAVGEIGLDYYWVKKNKISKPENVYEIQKYLLGKQLKLASKYDLPVVIHCRDIEGDKHAESDILSLITCECDSCVRGVFHSYTGSQDYLSDILNLGFYISFNGIVTYDGAKNVRDILRKVPQDKILLETDAPLLVPAKYKKLGYKTSEPKMIDEVADFVAKQLGLEEDRLWEIVENNFKRLFNV